MATFSPRPTEFEFPWYDTRSTYDQSLEAAITANETAAGVADAKAVAAQSTADTAVLDADAAQSRADDAFTNAATAQSTAEQGVIDASSAQGTADTALTNAATAQATADAALPVLAYTSNTDLDTLTTSGAYPSPWSGGTVALNFPMNLNTGFLLEVFASPTSSGVWQRLTPAFGPTRKGFWTRSKGSVSWSAWTFHPAQRIDNTAGRAIYTWDETQNREQRISGDTGWRDVSASFIPKTSGALAIYIRRENSLVTIAGDAVTLTEEHPALTPFLPLPTGFNSGPVISRAGEGYEVGRLFTAPGGLSCTTALAVGRRRFYFQFSTTEPWPTTLPGTAVGTIPHN